MKANEFIKQNGLDYAKERLDYCVGARLTKNELELKRLVESHDLIEKYKDCDVPRWHFIADYCYKMKISPYSEHNYVFAGKIYDEALADVESCQ